MKKTISTVILFALLISILGSYAIYANDPIPVSLSSASGYAGSVVSVSLSIGENSNIANAHFKVTYDRTKLEYVGYKIGVIGNTGYTSLVDNNDHLGIGFAAVNNVVTAGEMIQISFKILDETPNAVAEVALQILEFVDGDTDIEVPATITNGSVTTIPEPTQPPQKPAAPVLKHVGMSTVIVTWTEDETADGYMLYVNDIPVSNIYLTGNEYVITGLAPKTDYVVSLAAVNRAGLSVKSETTSLTTLESIMSGDVDFNGKVELADAMHVFRHCAGKSILQGDGFLAADINKDNSVALDDAMKVFQFVAGKIGIL